MCLKGIASIGHKDHHASPRFEHAIGLDHGCVVIIDVFQYLVGEDYIKRVIAKGQHLGRRMLDVGQVPPGFGYFVLVDIYAMDIAAEAQELSDIHAQAAADIEDALVFQRRIPADQRQTSVLAFAPYIAWVPQSDCLGVFHRQDSTTQSPKGQNVGQGRGFLARSFDPHRL